MSGRKTFHPLLLTFLLLSAGSVPNAAPQTAESPASPSPLQLALQAEVGRAQRAAAELGVHVVELDSGETVFGHQADVPRIIASNTKLFTTAAALDAFGPGYFFETRFVLRGSVRDGVLTGDLGVVGGGDPHISGRDFAGDSYAAFRPWAAALRARGIRRVTGDVYLDHGLFAPPNIHPDWPREQLTRWYEAPVDALSFSDNCILVRVWPSPSGGRPRVELLPDVPVVRIENTARTIPSRRGQQLIVHRTGDAVVVRGSIWKNSGPADTWVTIPDPVRYFGEGLRAALAEEGVTVKGALHPVEELPGAVWERVAVHRSDLLSILQVTNKNSQNFYAESLAKHLGALRCRHGSWPAGVQAIGELLQGIGVPAGSFTMADGSGMSRENRFAPRALTLLLRHMFFHPAGREFAGTLPYSGEDRGAWRRRMATPPYRGNVLAKTGTLSGVSALSGYAKAVSGKSYAFSILCNRTTGDARLAQDRLVMALIDNG
ncbi:MAG TPA: D-alanyl-D-alanine carboxypeptidase/D-alanyl-D-alanine-endopeptidase [Acidobacteria bacterium]|nr:D-alanyl-D-alanine carboxypeptidase/D-alanyl-D-alanine-endopeptidase [Acidobacteriota bacterium]